jgi:hypothetical protein
MVAQVDISQLSKECSQWRDSLRSYRENIGKYQEKLQKLVSTPLSKEDLKEVEHFHNQFHIQLINIHDLKQSIKMYDRKFNLANGQQLDEETLHEKEKLSGEYEFLTSTIKDLGTGFDQLISVSK